MGDAARASRRNNDLASEQHWLLQKEIDNSLEVYFTPNYPNEIIQDGMTSLLKLLLDPTICPFQIKRSTQSQ